MVPLILISLTLSVLVGWIGSVVLMARGAISSLSGWNDLADEWSSEGAVRSDTDSTTSNLPHSKPADEESVEADLDRYMALSA